MGIRYQKSIPLGKFARVNLTASGASLSLGPKGASININPRRGVSGSINLPGGFSWRCRGKGK